jgi:hypothetical protein
VLQALAVGDVDGDGVDDILVCGDDRVFVLDGEERSLKREYDFTATSFGACFALYVVDLNGDTLPEIVVSARRQILVGDPRSGQLLWETQASNRPLAVAVGNVDLDTAIEIVDADGGLIYDGATLTVQWSYPGGFGISVAVGDVTGDGISEIIADKIEESEARSLVVYSADDASVLYTMPFSGAASGGILVTGSNGESAANVLVDNGSGQISAYAHDTVSNSLVAEYGVNLSDAAPLAQTTAYTAGDTDGDGADELVFAVRSTPGELIVVAGGSPPTGIEWSSTTDMNWLGPFAGGLLLQSGDPARLVFSSASNGLDPASTRLIATRPDDRDPTVSVAIGSGLSLPPFAPFILADYDPDDVHEIFVGSAQDGAPFIAAYDLQSGAVEWRSTDALHSGEISQLLSAELSGDDRSDLIVYSRAEDEISFVDVSNHVSLNRLSVPRLSDIEFITGEPGKLILAHRFGVDLYTARSGTANFSLESSYTELSNPWNLVRTDIDGDGDNELFVLATSESGMALFRFNDDLELEDTVTVSNDTQAIYVEDLGLPRKNLVVVGGTSLPDRLITIDPDSGIEIMRSPSFFSQISPDGISYSDIDSDGTYTIGIATADGIIVTR